MNKNEEIVKELNEKLGYLTAVFMSQEIKGTQIVMPTEELNKISDWLEQTLTTKDQEIKKVVEGLRKDETKKKHVGKSWCPDCEDTGYNYALDDLLKAISK